MTGITIESGITIGGGITIGSGTSGGTGGSSSAFTLTNFATTLSGTTITGTGASASINGTFTHGNDSHGHYVRIYSGGYITVTGYNISSSPFTIRMIASLEPAGYWATLWGNENWNAGTGWLAYMGSAYNLTVSTGGQSSSQSYSISSYSTTSQYDFVFDGTTVTVYKNGTSLGTKSFSDPSSPASNDLYIGSRHVNNGTGNTDTCGLHLYLFEKFNSALSSSTISSDYTTNQSIYHF
jgi:hypothetical protein